MLEERLILSISYVLIAALLLVFCFYTSFSKKLKLTSIFVVSLFYIFSWKGYIGVLGWPTPEELPDDLDEFDAVDIYEQICEQRRKRGYVDYSELRF